MDPLDNIIESTIARVTGQEPPADPPDDAEEDDDIQDDELTPEDDGEEGDEQDGTDPPDESDDAEDITLEEARALKAQNAELSQQVAGVMSELQALTNRIETERTDQERRSQDQESRDALAALQKRWDEMDDPQQAANEKMQMLAALVQKEREQREQLERQHNEMIQSQQQSAIHGEVASFIARGGRVIDGKIVENAAEPLDETDLQYMMQYVVPNGQVMEQWANDRIASRKSRKREARKVKKSLHGSTPRVSSPRNGKSAARDPKQPRTLDEIIDSIPQGIRRGR